MTFVTHSNGTTTKQKVRYEGVLLAEVDYRKTTAWKEFCAIRFVGSAKWFYIQGFKLETK